MAIVAKQHGAPLRLAVPWKYGFKSTQVDRAFYVYRQAAKGHVGGVASRSEYGFWANVNPAVPHPRWSQAAKK